MTRQQLLDRLMVMRDAGEDMRLPLLVRVEDEHKKKRDIYGSLRNVCNGSYGLGKTGVWSGLMIAVRENMK